jgi:alpha-ribazole phosphatase
MKRGKTVLQLIFVRHGETDSNKKGTYLGWTDVELNQEGIRQAHHAKEKLKGIKVDGIYSSPLKRVCKTTEIINENFNVKINYVNDLKERNFGIWDNLTYREITEGYREAYECWVKDWVGYCIEGGESAQQIHSRISGFLKHLIDSHNDGTYIIVTHLGCIRHAIANLFGMSIEDSWHFTVDNASITKFEITDRYSVLTLLNG